MLAFVDDDAPVVRREARSPSAILRAQLVGVDDVLVDLEQRHVVVERLVQQDHELDQVRARLLPERLLAAAKQVGHQRGDAVGQRVGIEIVVQRVVAVRRVEADLDVVVAAAVALEECRGRAGRSRLSPPGPGRRPCAPDRSRDTPSELLDVRIHAGRRLARADGADDERCPCRGRAPEWSATAASARAGRRGAAMLLAEDQEQIVALLRRVDTAGSGAGATGRVRASPTKMYSEREARC